MIDEDPFGPSKEPVQLLTYEEATQGWQADEYGILVPPFWSGSPGWARMPRGNRQRISDAEAKHLMYKPVKAKRAVKPRASTSESSAFTTQYAVTWGKSQGWKLLDREYSVSRGTGKSSLRVDLLGCADAKFRKPDGSLVFVQAAGPNERASHREKFDRNRHKLLDFKAATFLYAVFVRGNKTPIEVEVWE